jgi:hypothetical protein
MRRSAHIVLLSLLPGIVPAAQALEPACETYLRAAEKSARQPARHSITETDGLRMEVIVVGGRSYSRVGGGWNPIRTDLLAAERKLTAAIRAGTYPLTGCRKLGAANIAGVPTTLYAYTLKIPGMPGGEAKAYIGGDGLVHAQSTDDAEVRHRYRGITAPAL